MRVRISMPGFTLIILLVFCFLIMPNWSFAQRSIFDEEVIAKWKAYEVFSRRLQGTAHGNGILFNGKPRLILEHYKQNRECACFSKGGSEPAFDNWFISNPRYAAQIKSGKENPADAVLLKYEETENAPIFGGRPVADQLFLDTSHHFSCCGVPLSKLMSKPKFSAKIVGKESHDGRDLIRIDYDDFNVNPKTSLKTTIHGSVYFDPMRCWCVCQDKRISHVVSRGGEWEYVFDDRYETIDHPSGFPLLKRWAFTIKRKPLKQQNPKQLDGTTTIDYEWEINDRVPNEKFTLSAFGLPEPGSDTVVKKSMPTYVWIFLSAAVCALLAIGLRYAARRRRSLQAS